MTVVSPCGSADVENETWSLPSTTPLARSPTPSVKVMVAPGWAKVEPVSPAVNVTGSPGRELGLDWLTDMVQGFFTTSRVDVQKSGSKSPAYAMPTS